MNGIVFLLVIAVLLFVFFLLGLRNIKREKKEFTERCRSEIGAAPSSRYESKSDLSAGYFKKHKDSADFVIDDITWNDLSMDEVYKRVCYCESAVGKEYLYYMLRTPVINGADSFEDREKELEELGLSTDGLLKLKWQLHRLGSPSKYSIYEYLDKLDEFTPGGNFVHIAAIILLIVSVLIMIFGNFMAGFAMFILVAAYNIVTYFQIKSKIDPYLKTFSYIKRMVRMIPAIAEAGEYAFPTETETMRFAASHIKGLTNGAGIVLSGTSSGGSANPIDMVLDYVRMLTHIDIIKFNSMFMLIKDREKSVDEIISCLGYMDAMLSVWYYRKSLNGKYVLPEFAGNGAKFCIEDGCHPLLSNPVGNGVNIEKGLLITGSNASGKSTFLKMCAVNMIFAQTIHTVLGSRYKASLFRPYSSMALKDDLYAGDSYYMVEIKSLKRILDAIDAGSAPVMCFIDEVLRGTNTTERIAASSRILEYFASSKCLCFAATHDLELSELLKDSFEIYHFEGDMVGDDVKFDYKIKPGRNMKRNAIRLLKSIGYDSSIVESAEKMAEEFERTGNWSLG